jgi:DNA polymerase IIIc chi subunit
MFLTILTFLSAISISVIAAGYSIIGLATLFAGAVIPIIAMGSALEVGKLVAASWLYNNWNSDVPRLLKAYLFGAIVVLIFITSMGIFGFLSKAHLDQVKPTSSNNIKIELLDNQINQQQLIINRSQKTLDQLDKALEVYIEKEFVTRGLKERKKQEEERTELNNAINKASDKIAELTNQKANLNLEQDKIEAEVGPIKYVAELIYGENAQDNFDKSVRIVILILIFVFDPLAVLLLIAANISLRQWRMKKVLVKENRNQDLRKKIQKLEKRNKRLKGFKDITRGLGDNPDEIKVKLNEIMSINDRQDRNI